MGTAAALQKNLAELQADFERLRDRGEIRGRALVLFESMLLLLTTVVMLLVERKTPKSPANSGLPGTRSGEDGTAVSASGSKGKGRRHHRDECDNIRLAETFEVREVGCCANCGHDLTRVTVSAHERRSLIDIVFVTEQHHVDAEIKRCPVCGHTTRGVFPDTMPGPLQYGAGVVAYAVHLLVSQMISVRRTAQLFKVMTGRLISEATLLAWVMRVHQALAEWESAAIGRLLQMPVMHADETSIRIDRKNHWLHSYSSGDLVVKLCHPRRGREAIDAINIIPRYGAGRSRDDDDDGDEQTKPVLVHDRWASYFNYTDCAHALCGAHLLRDLQFIIDAHDHRWARRMQKLLGAANREVAQTQRKALSDQRFKAVRKQYRTIVTQGTKELPPLPERTARRGRIAKTDAHNLLEAFATYETEILRFTVNPVCPMTNNLAERSIRMSKVKQKISGTFRSAQYADAYCRISSYLQSMNLMGYNPLTAIQIALNNKAADILDNNE